MSSGRVVSLVLSLMLASSLSPLLAIPPEPDSPLPSDIQRFGDGGAPVDPWNETPFRTVAVPGGFSHQTYADYSDVAVIINNRSAASRTIGYAFAAARWIPAERILLLTNDSTPTAETITPEQYDDYFAEPISEMIRQRNLTGQLNVLVTTKGVPLRVSGATNARASFDSELSLLDSNLPTLVHDGWWGGHEYGPWDASSPQEYAGWTDEPLPRFSRAEQGFYIVTRLTGYDVETALGLIDRANSSLGSRGLGVLDLATNRNGSGYKYWNDALYLAETIWNETLGYPVHFNQNSTFVTDQDDVMFYSSWGSNDGSWSQNHLPNAGFDTADSGWPTGAEHWSSQVPAMTANESFDWSRQTAVSRNGAASLEGVLSPAPCSITEANGTVGLLAEYFDNAGLSFNLSLMPNLTGRQSDHTRSESQIDNAASNSPWSGLDDRFADRWSVRHTGSITIPESGNWTFHLNSDDGTKLWIDGAEVVDHQGEHSMAEVSDSVWLDAGRHSLRTEYFEHGGSAGFILSWSGPNLSKQVIPASAFSRGTGLPVVQNELIHHWTFDESNGSSAADSVGDANLTLHGGNGSGWQPCLFGNCLAFDGTDDYAAVDVSDWGGDFSVSLWLKTDNSSQDRYSTAFAVNDVAGDNASFQIMAGGGTDGDWEVYHDVSYTFGAIEAGVWTHLAVTFQNGSLYQYMNGELVRSTSVPNSTIDSIELYKLGVNRAGSTYFEGLIDDVRIWNRTLTAAEVGEVETTAARTCSDHSAAGGRTHIEQTYDLPDELDGHAWIIYGYASKQGWVSGDWHIEIDAYDDNGTLLTSNSSSSNSLDDAWNSRTVRFRPAGNATSLVVRMVASLGLTTRNGSVFFDTMNLRAIRPHFQWQNGSIAETAVSTGGRSFAWGSNYGQSLVADLLEDGVSGVKGYVYEPYLTTISYPNLLSAYYGAGYNLGEAYWASNPAISWMGVVVGDPKMAAYSDQLHDVDVVAARTNGRLSMGENGTVEVLVENLGPAEARGWLEVRERIGQIVLSNVSLQMSPGDENGSRRIVQIPVKTQRQGYVELVVEYIADDGPVLNSSEFVQPRILREHVTDNNWLTLNPLVNGPPTITSFWCSSAVAPRGSTVSCNIFATDEFGIGEVRFAWWHVDAGFENSTWLPVTSVGGGEYRVSLDIPVSIPLGYLWVLAEVTDIDGLQDFSVLNDAIDVRDAPATWFGVHAAGADPADWSGASMLPAVSQAGVHRGANTTLRACVIDPDHSTDDEKPRFVVARGAVSPVLLESEPTPETTVICYTATWWLDPGTPLDPILLTLQDSAGQALSVRSMQVDNRAPTVEVHLVRNGERVGISTAVGESIEVNATDVDDPGSALIGEVLLRWPGQSERTVPFVIPADATGALVELPNATAPLAGGSLNITVLVRDQQGSETEVEESWLIHRVPPNVTAVLCAEWNGSDWVGIDDATIDRGVPVLLVAGVFSHRPLLMSRATLSQSGWSTQLEPFTTDWPTQCSEAAAAAREGAGSTLYIVTVDASLVVGEASIELQATDVDMMQSSFSLTVQIAYPGPEIIDPNWPASFQVGESSVLSFTVLDPDDLDSVVCELQTIDGGGNRMLDLLLYPGTGGVVAAIWTPSRTVADLTIRARCADSAGHEAELEALNLTVETVPVVNEEPAPPEQESESSAAGWRPIAAIAGLLLLFATIAIAVTAILTRRDDEAKWAVTDNDGEPVETAGWDAPSVTDTTAATDATTDVSAAEGSRTTAVAAEPAPAASETWPPDVMTSGIGSAETATASPAADEAGALDDDPFDV